jgi:hypothetical protein
MKKNAKKIKKIKLEKKSVRDIIQEQYEDIDLLFMDPEEYDKAIIKVCDGISINYNPKVAYDYNKVIEVNMSMGMTNEEAVEYFDFNQGGAYLGENTPVFINKLEV